MLKRSLITSKTLTPCRVEKAVVVFTLIWCYSSVTAGLFALRLNVSEVAEGQIWTFDHKTGKNTTFAFKILERYRMITHLCCLVYQTIKQQGIIRVSLVHPSPVLAS